MIALLFSIITTVVGISLRPMLYLQPIDPGRQRGAAMDKPKHSRNTNHKTANELDLFILTRYRSLKVLS